MAQKQNVPYYLQIPSDDNSPFNITSRTPIDMGLDNGPVPIKPSLPVMPNGVPTQVAMDQSTAAPKKPLTGMAALQAAANPQSDTASQLMSMVNSPENQALRAKYDALAEESRAKQQAAIDAQQQQLTKIQNMPQQVNLSGLGALADMANHSTYNASSYKAPESPQDLAAKVYGLQNTLTGQQNSMTTQDLQNLKDHISQMGGLSQLAALARIGQRDQSNGMRADNIASGAVDKVTNDPIIQQAIPRVLGVQRIQSQIADMKNGKFLDTPQFLNDINLEYTAALSGRNNSAEGTMERVNYDNAANRYANIMQQIKSAPQGVNTPGILNQIQSQISGLGQNWQKAIDDRSSMLQRNYAHVPAATSAQAKAIQDMKKTYGSGIVSAPQSSGPDVNADLTKMSPAELQNYISTHGGK